MKKRFWIYDLETFPGIFTATFLDRDSDDKRVFVLSNNRDDINNLFSFLKDDVRGLIGFNCINFDAQVLEYIYRNPKCSAIDIRNYAEYITSSNDLKLDVPEWRLRIPHLDLYRIHHFDNKNKRTSLKWCEFMMDMDNIEDLPSDGEGSNWEEQVLSYNFNDVLATKKLYERTIPMIKLRMELNKLYGINVDNASDSKIGSELLFKLYCSKTHRYPSDVRSGRTYRKNIRIKDIIFPYINFKSDEFKYLLNDLKSKEINSTKGELDYEIPYKGFNFIYGSGGIHGSLSNKVVESNDEYVIIDADVSSLYPSIAVVNKMYPRHLGEEFYQIYKEEIVDVRLAEKAKKDKGNKSIVEGFKQSANSVYGKSNDIYSWMYDPLYTMQTTINGQLMLTMLAESLLEIKNINLIQINTDGLTVKIPKDQVELYYQKCKEWEKITNLQLEFVEYKKMIILDVNNYIAVYKDDKKFPKCKGRCEFKDIPLHKNKSHNIIPIAFFEYFVNGKSIEETITNHRNIFDFCAGVRAKRSEKKGTGRFELQWLEKGELKKQKLSKTVRYFISTNGKTLFKSYDDGSISHIEAPTKTGKLHKEWKVTYFNKKFNCEDFKDYNIDYTYYIYKTRELINLFEDRTLTLFE